MLEQRQIRRYALSAATLVGGALALGQDATSQSRMRLLDSISGESLLAIQLALPELARRGLTPEGYKISVWATGAATAVMFEQALIRSGQIEEGVQRKPSVQVVLPGTQAPRPGALR